ncbi:MAG: formate dehydrogenase accessory sulfurtransferase FdhD [Cognaticolwellia sp.]
MNIKTSEPMLEPENPATTELAKFRYHGNGRTLLRDHVVIEQPLQIRLLWKVHNNSEYHSQVFSITMRTPGDDKALIIGLMQSEGIIAHYHQLESVLPEVDEQQAHTTNDDEINNQWRVTLTAGVVPNIKSLERFQVTYSSCGLCGTTSLKSLELKNPPRLNQTPHWLAFDMICAMPELMRTAQAQFVQTGGSHAAALFDKSGQLLDIKEDIGRHNALDKLLGTRLAANDIDQSPACVLVSGRISFEIVQKTVMAGIAVLIAVGAPSALAILAAKRFDLTLIGFTKKTGFNLYHGDWRLLPLEETCQKI